MSAITLGHGFIDRVHAQESVDSTGHTTEIAGACCLYTGTCISATEEECVGLEGLFIGAGPCEPNPCPSGDNGACCFSDGSCALLSSHACDGHDGVYLGFFDVCSPNPCPRPEGACCLSDGKCVSLKERDCFEDDGNWIGPATECDTRPCATPQLDRSWGMVKKIYRDRL